MKYHRNRSERLEIWVTPEEKEIIYEKMAQYGTNNLSAYLRKMALDGYVINLDLSDVRALSTRLQHYGNNLNQIAKRVNSTGRIYEEYLREIQDNQLELTATANNIISALAKFG